MRNHFNTCKARQNGSTGVMRNVVLVSGNKSITATTSAVTTLTPARSVSHSSRRTFDSSNSSSWLDSMPSEEQSMLEELFARAMHRSLMAFPTFETKYWKSSSRSGCTPHGLFLQLPASRIGGELLVAAYTTSWSCGVRGSVRLPQGCAAGRIGHVVQHAPSSSTRPGTGIDDACQG